MRDRLLPIGLTGLAAVFLLNNPVFELDMRRHQLAGMLLSHLSVAAVLAGLWPRRQALAAGLPRWRPRTWVTAAAVGSAAILASWTVLFNVSPPYAGALARESGPLEPLQAGFYTVAAWLAWQCARHRAAPARRLYRATSGLCLWLVLEEIEYFGLVEILTGGIIEGVWVRSLHDLIALGMRVPAVLVALTAAAAVLAVAGVWHVGPRCLVREASSAATVPALAAAGTLAMSQVLDQDSGALRGYVGALTNRLEEPLELVTAFLVTMALVMKIGPAGGDVAPRASRSRPEQQPGPEHVRDGDEHALDQDRSR